MTIHFLRQPPDISLKILSGRTENSRVFDEDRPGQPNGAATEDIVKKIENIV